MLQIFAFCLIAPREGRMAWPDLPSSLLIERGPRGETQLCHATTQNLIIHLIKMFISIKFDHSFDQMFISNNKSSKEIYLCLIFLAAIVSSKGCPCQVSRDAGTVGKSTLWRGYFYQLILVHTFAPPNQRRCSSNFAFCLIIG